MCPNSSICGKKDGNDWCGCWGRFFWHAKKYRKVKKNDGWICIIQKIVVPLHPLLKKSNVFVVSLAQLVEQLTLNQWVEGSSPSGDTLGKRLSLLAISFWFCIFPICCCWNNFCFVMICTIITWQRVVRHKAKKKRNHTSISLLPGSATRTRTGVYGVRGRCPRPLDDSTKASICAFFFKSGCKGTAFFWYTQISWCFFCTFFVFYFFYGFCPALWNTIVCHIHILLLTLRLSLNS